MKRAATCLLAFWLSVPSAAPAVDWERAEKEALELFAGFVRIDTTNPPADVRKAADYLEKVLLREGIKTERFHPPGADGKVNLLARLPGRQDGRALLMLAHMDVVPADPARWTHPPFGADLIGGELWGRGTLDMKGQGILEMMSMILLKREGIVPARDLCLLFSCDEETGGEQGAGWMAASYFAKTPPEYVLDEGASGSRGIYTDDGRLVFAVAVDEKKVLWMKLVARGDSGHGSMPDRRVSAEKLARAIVRIKELEPKPRRTAVVRDMKKRLGRLADNPVTRALSRTTLTVTALRAGVGDPPSVNIVPGEAYAMIDCRLLPEDSASAMISRIKGALKDPDIELEVIHRPSDSSPQDYDSPLYRVIERTVSRHFPEAITVPALLAGGTDARHFRALGAKAYGFEPFVRTAAQESLIHGDDERVVVRDFNRALRLYYDTLREFLE